MDEKGFKELLKKLEEINEVINKLDPAIRSEAFSLMKPYLVGTHGHPHDGHNAPAAPGGADTGDAEKFFTSHPEGKPADNAVLGAAYLYGQYGSQPFSIADVREVADSVGMTIPQHPAMTFKQSRRNGKSLFQHVGKNQYKPTVHGEAYFKTQLKVKKGTKPRTSSEES